jgi:hypothetical protein
VTHVTDLQRGLSGNNGTVDQLLKQPACVCSTAAESRGPAQLLQVNVGVTVLSSQWTKRRGSFIFTAF